MEKDRITRLYEGFAPPKPDPLPGWAIAIILLLASSFFSYVFLNKFGLNFLIVASGGLIILAMLTWASLKELSFALVLWMFTMCGFRTMALVSMPGLPDFSFDRLLLIWIIVMFIFQVVLGRERFRGPYAADIIILLHTVYILVQVQVINSSHFHNWVLSSLGPFFAYLYGKYTIHRDRELRNVLIFFLLITIYFYVMSIAQQFNWKSIIWPKTILDQDLGLWHRGRSRGPVLHPPLFGQLLGMFLLVQFYFFTAVQKTWVRALLVGSIFLSFMGIFFTYTRGPWLATMAALGVMALLRPRYRQIMAFFAVVAVLAGLLGAMQMANSDFLQERMQNTDTIENRLGFLVNAMLMIRDHPFFGVGYFRFNEYRGLYNQAAYIPLYGFIKKGAAAHTPIHDIYIGRMAEEGMFSTFLQFAFYFVIFRAFVTKWRSNPQGRWFNRDALALFAAIMVNYLIGGMIIDYRYFDLVNVIFYFLAGVIYGYSVESPEPIRTLSHD